MTYFQSKLFLKCSKTFKCFLDKQDYFTVKLVNQWHISRCLFRPGSDHQKDEDQHPKNETFSVSCLKIYTTSTVENRAQCFSIVGKQRKEILAEIYRYGVFVTKKGVHEHFLSNWLKSVLKLERKKTSHISAHFRSIAIKCPLQKNSVTNAALPANYQAALQLRNHNYRLQNPSCSLWILYMMSQPPCSALSFCSYNADFSHTWSINTFGSMIFKM